MRRILFFANAGIGNLLQFLPTIEYLKKNQPANEINCVILKPYLEEIIRECEFIDNVYNFTKKGPSSLTHLPKCDIALLTIHESYFYPMLMVLLRAKKRIGFDYIGHWHNRYRFFLTDRISVNEVEKEGNIYARLITPIGLNIYGDIRPFFPEPHRSLEELDSWWKNRVGESRVVALHVTTSSRQSWKAWRVDKYRILCLKIIDAFPDVKLIFLGSSDEEILVNTVTSQLPSSHYLNIFDRPLIEIGAILKKCSLFIGNDSGLMHIANAVNTNIITLFGPTNDKLVGPVPPAEIIKIPLQCSPCYTFPNDQYMPLSCQQRRCLEGITADMVLQKIHTYLAWS